MKSDLASLAFLTLMLSLFSLFLILLLCVLSLLYTFGGFLHRLLRWDPHSSHSKNFNRRKGKSEHHSRLYIVFRTSVLYPVKALCRCLFTSTKNSCCITSRQHPYRPPPHPSFRDKYCDTPPALTKAKKKTKKKSKNNALADSNHNAVKKQKKKQSRHQLPSAPFTAPHPPARLELPAPLHEYHLLFEEAIAPVILLQNLALPRPARSSSSSQTAEAEADSDRFDGPPEEFIQQVVSSEWIALESDLHAHLPDYHYIQSSVSEGTRFRSATGSSGFSTVWTHFSYQATNFLAARAEPNEEALLDSAFIDFFTAPPIRLRDPALSPLSSLALLDLFHHEVEYAYRAPLLDVGTVQHLHCRSHRRTPQLLLLHQLLQQQLNCPSPMKKRPSVTIHTKSTGAGRRGTTTTVAASEPSSPSLRRRLTATERQDFSTPPRLKGTPPPNNNSGALSQSPGAAKINHQSSISFNASGIHHQATFSGGLLSPSPSKVQMVPAQATTSKSGKTDAPRSMTAAQPSSGVRAVRAPEADGPFGTGDSNSATNRTHSGGNPPIKPTLTTVHQSAISPSISIKKQPTSPTRSSGKAETNPKQLKLEIIENLHDADYGLVDDDDDDSKSANSSINSSYCGSPRSPRGGKGSGTFRMPRVPESHYDAENDEPFVYNRREEEKAVSQFFEHGSIILERDDLEVEDSFRPPPAPRGSTAGAGLLLGSVTSTPEPSSSTAKVIPPLPDLNGDRKARDTIVRQVISRASYLAGESPSESTGLRISGDSDALGAALLPPPSTLHSRSASHNLLHKTNEAIARVGGESSGAGATFQCRSLSLYEAFFLDRSKKKWLVDDMVLAKCFEYVGLMGYEHPQYRKDRAKCQPSLWSNSASIPSPLTKVASDTAGMSTAASLKNDVCVDGVLRRYRLSHKPNCQAERTGVSTTFLAYEEAMRWVLAREYVIGAILLVCASPPLHGDSESSSEPCIPPNTHPIFWLALHVHTFYPQWGDFQTFSTLWETQVRLVLTPASASRQRTIRIHEDGLVFSSDREGGNLARVERSPDQPGMFYLWLEPDLNSDKRIWFRFSVTGVVEGKMLRFKLLNAAPHLKLYRSNGMMPVWRDGMSQVHWGPVDQCGFRLTNNDLDGELTFAILPRNSTETIQVAFCAPYTYADLLCHLVHWHCLVQQNPAAKIRFEERVLGYSPEGRKQHCLIITSPTSAICRKTIVNNPGRLVSTSASARPSANSSFAGKKNIHIDPNARYPVEDGNDVKSPYSNFSAGKKVVLISGRVHPGEITASHGLHGLVTYLLSGDPGAARLRDHFIFLVVPMLNPDGVSRGHSRMDQWGVNLNRSYHNPDPAREPTIYQLKKLFEGLLRTHRERFFMYIDFHSHASQSTSFMFGNHLPEEVHHWNKAYPRLVELHSQNLFTYSVCRFGKSHMSTKDGASRVLFGTSLIHSYTIELPHFTDRAMFTERLSGMITGHFGLEGGPGTLMSKQGNHLDKSNFGMAFLNNLPPESAATAASLLSARHQKAPRGAADRPTSAPTNSSGTTASARRPITAKKKKTGAKLDATIKTFNQSAALMDLPLSARSTLSNSTSGRQPLVQRRSLIPGSSGAPPTVPLSARGSVARHRGKEPHETLQPIAIPSILHQSALVGAACLLALLDYASLNEGTGSKKHTDSGRGVPCSGASALLAEFGGMARILAVVKKDKVAKKKKKSKK